MTVFVFLSPGSAAAYACMPTAESMSIKSEQMGGRFFGVVSGNNPPTSKVECFRKDSHAEFPILIDRDRKLDTIFGAQEVGTVIIMLDKKRIYTGPIDHSIDSLTENNESITLEEELDILAKPSPRAS
jgi:hypothetical protein